MFGFTLHDDVDDIELFIFWRLRSYSPISEGYIPRSRWETEVPYLRNSRHVFERSTERGPSLSTGHAFQWRRSVANKGD